MLGDGRRFTPESVAKPKRRILTVANVLILIGVLATGGGLVDKLIAEAQYGFSNSPASNLITDYEKTTEALGREGALAQIPQKFNSQQVEEAYKEVDGETNRKLLETGLLLSGLALAGAGALSKPPRRTR